MRPLPSVVPMLAPITLRPSLPAVRPTTATGCVTIDGGHCRAGQAFQPGEAVSVMVRPEDVTLAAANAPASNGHLTWPGKVVDGVFRGPRRSLTVETAGLRFNVECASTRAAAVGETVTLLVDADNAWALKA